MLSTSGLPGCRADSIDGIRFEIVDPPTSDRRNPERLNRSVLSVTLIRRIAHDIVPGTTTHYSRAESWYLNPTGAVFHNPAVRGGSWPTLLVISDEEYLIAVYNGLDRDPDYPSQRTLCKSVSLSVRRYASIGLSSTLAPLSWAQLRRAALSTRQDQVERRTPRDPVVPLVDAYLRTADWT